MTSRWGDIFLKENWQEVRFVLGNGLVWCWQVTSHYINTLRPSQHGRHFPDDIFKCILLNANAWISIKISLKLVPKGPINNIPALVQIMAWRRSGDKPLSEPMMVRLLTHICVTQPQWVNNNEQIHCHINVSLSFSFINSLRSSYAYMHQ